MTKQETNSYAWLDAQEVKHQNQQPHDNAKEQKRMFQKMLDFLDMM